MLSICLKISQMVKIKYFDWNELLLLPDVVSKQDVIKSLELLVDMQRE